MYMYVSLTSVALCVTPGWSAMQTFTLRPHSLPRAEKQGDE